MKDLPKAYNPKEVEDQIYQKWEASGFFNPDNLPDGEAFSIAMPPPNITAELHVGHSIGLALQDLMIRHARMSGKKALWLPGTDHAAIATQNVVEKKIKETENKTRFDLGRDELLKRIEEFISVTRGRIQMQTRKMGASCDWSREKYTMSPEMNLAVRTNFKNMHDAGLIYRGYRIVNWCPRCGTTLADDEVEHRAVADSLYHIRYPLKNRKGHITIATTRPETMLGDTAVAVNPKDARYKNLIGQTVMLPLINREIPIVADEHADMEFGTGALKVTPGHDPHDFEIARRHNLPIINLFTPEGEINAQEALDRGFEAYANLQAKDAREKIINELREKKFLEKTESLEHNVGFCYRCGTRIEPIVSKQWFVNVNQKLKITNQSFKKKLKLSGDASLKEMAMAAVQSGAIKIVPERFAKIYLHWMKNLHDWNISRQIWFGHRIPVYYCTDCEEVIVEIEKPQTCRACNSPHITQDPDTLDTWFSSGAWTFSTLGWPQQTDDLKIYHPTSVLETSYDILFFWVARMILMTTFAMQDIPFRTVYLHGLVRDKNGKKMSKSLGNVLNPLEIIEKYGTDALRLSLIIGNTPGNDLKISEEKIAAYRNFANKLWNIARYILTSSPSPKKGEVDLPAALSLARRAGERPPKPQSLADEWILAELENVISEVWKHIANYQYGLAGEELEKFTWNKFADWYLEVSKMTRGRQGRAGGDPDPTQTILVHILKTLLKLWHPFIPFVTEHIWAQFSSDLLMMQKYPEPGTKKSDAKVQKKLQQFIKLQELITGLRNLRAEYRQEPSKIIAVYLKPSKPSSWIKDQQAVIERLARVKLNFAEVGSEKRMPYFVWEDTRVYLIMPKFDPEVEFALAEKDLRALEPLIGRLQAQLGKKEFLKKAPAEVVEHMQQQRDLLLAQKTRLEEKIRQLK